MDFKISKSVLARTLGNIIKIVPPKSTYTVLQNIILEAKRNALSIEATDLDVFIKRIIPAEIKTEGKILVPGKKILEITRESNIDDVIFKLKELNLQITAGNAHFNIPSLDYQEFPDVPKFPEKKWFEITVGEIQEMITSTIFMVSKDISRRPMNGVFVQLKDGELRFVTTDGYRLGLDKREKDGPNGDMIIATKVFDLIDFGAPEEKLAIYKNERMVGVKFLDTTIIARLIEGPYPNYEGVIPKTFVGTCAIDKTILDGALKRVSLVASPHLKNVRFDFRTKGIILSASSPDIGEAKEEIPCVYEGDKLDIWFNSSFWLETLRHLSSNDIAIQLSSQSTAALIREKGNEHLLYLLMPLRIDSME
jgi:DNA polymerase-3 subunit beta